MSNLTGIPRVRRGYRSVWTETQLISAYFPEPAYPLPEVYADRSQRGPTILRGSLFTSSGEPIAGARVEVRDFALNPPWPFLSCVTGASGDWAIWLPDRSRFEAAPLRIPGPRDDPIKKLITVRIQYPDQNGFSVDVTDDVLLGTEHAIRNTALRGQVRGPGGRPIIGARIETSVGPEASVLAEQRPVVPLLWS